MSSEAMQNRSLLSGTWLSLIGLLVATGWWWSATAAEKPVVKLAAVNSPKSNVHFGRDIQPIFAKRCLACHGPDQAKGGLRLDKKDKALAELDSGERAIVPQKLDKSALIARITTTEKSERMPPQGAPLTEREISLLKQWIQDGAAWESHWSFEPVSKAQPPAVSDQKWVRNPIDAFVLNRLEAAGLTPAPPASKLALLRRVTFDLTGLPPTPAEVDAYLADNSPNAYEKLVDRLLASPRYGERWARHWLDVVRYADTNSYERDDAKPHSWRYRDYVIRSLNDDKPYDQFVREQIAGDELPNPTADSIIATGFYRLGIWDDEPTDPLQARYDVLDDILTTTGQTFLGLTVNCARCHDHKIDPIPQKEYYSLLAFFQNITTMARKGPNIEVPIFTTPEKKQQFLAEQQKLDARRHDVLDQIISLEDDLLKKIAVDQKVAAPKIADSQRPDLEGLEFRNYLSRWKQLPNFKLLNPAMQGDLPHGLVDIRYSVTSYDFGTVFTGTLHVPADGDYTFTLDSDEGSRLILGTKTVIDSPTVRRMGKPDVVKVGLRKGPTPFRLEYFQFAGPAGLILKWSGPGFQDRWLSASGGGAIRHSDEIDKDGSRLLGEAAVKKYRQLRVDLEALKVATVPGEYALAVTEGHGEATDTFVFVRGNAHVQGEKVHPTFPGIFASPLPQLPRVDGSETVGRRLVLANWIMSPENRLTSRVVVNRIWQQHFGRGIVRSTNNFGLLGDAPTHPALLDWLATELVRLNWRLKPLHKLIVLSSTYRMSSQPSSEALKKDPNNDLLSHFDLRRLGAEEIRDSILAINGRLNLNMYGPGVFPPISKEVMAGQSRPGEGWGKSTPEDQVRRSVYIHVKRSLVTPLLSEFDFPDTDSTCAARFSTTQPTQSLGMLNGEFLHQQAAGLAQRIVREAGADRTAQVKLALKLVLGRPADEKSVERGLALLDMFEQKHKTAPDKARQYFCLMLYNLNEFLYVD
jgi:mono/diheme cytochrome c family protein